MTPRLEFPLWWWCLIWYGTDIQSLQRWWLRTQTLPRYLSVSVIFAVIEVKHCYWGHITWRGCTVSSSAPCQCCYPSLSINVCISVRLCVTVSVFMLCVVLRQSPEPSETYTTLPWSPANTPHAHSEFAIFDATSWAAPIAENETGWPITEAVFLFDFYSLYSEQSDLNNPREWAKEHN